MLQIGVGEFLLQMISNSPYIWLTNRKKKIYYLPCKENSAREDICDEIINQKVLVNEFWMYNE